MKEIFIISNSAKKFEQTYYSIDSNWFNYFTDFKVTTLPNAVSRLNNFLDKSTPSAFVFSGGGDISSNNLVSEGFDEKREEVEEFLIEYSIKNHIPLVAICRGMQKVITYLEKEINFVENKIAIKEHYAIDNLTLSNNSTISTRTCFNNYSIPFNKEIENSWNVLQVDKHNNLLCIQHKKYKILCFMWHPERDETDFETISDFIN